MRRANPQPLQKYLLGLRVLLKGVAALQQVCLTQQPASTGIKPRKEKHPFQTVRPHRWQAVAAADPVFGTQVFEIDPQRRFFASLHRLQIAFRQFAGKGLDHHVGNLRRRPLRRPLANLNPLLPLLRSADIRLGAQRHKRTQVIDPQPYALLMLGHQLPGQTPGHPDVAVIIDHAAKNIPGGFHTGLQHSKGGIVRIIGCVQKS